MEQQGSKLGKDAPVELLHMGAIEMLRVYLRYHWAYPSVFSYDPGPGLSRLSCPVLLINAELDRLAQADVSAVKLVRSGSLKLIPEIAGPVPWRAPQVYADEVLAFLNARSAVG